MHSVVIVIQYVCIIGLFFEDWIVFRKWNSRLHACLFFSITVNLINSVGYLFELQAESEEAYFMALQISYFGRVWTGLALLLFIAELCRIKFPNILLIGLILFHIATYIVILTVQKHELYYTNMEFVKYGDSYKLLHGMGVWHILYSVVIVGFIIYGLSMLFIAHHKERDKTSKKRLLMVLLAMISISIFFIVQTLKLVSITDVYDVTMIGYTVATLFMLIAMLRYDLLGTEQLAKEYIIDKLSEGIVAADKNGNTAYFNKPAEAIFPELSGDSREIQEKLQAAIKRKRPLHINGRIYTPRTDTLYRNGEVSGTVYVLQDNTELYKHAQELEEMTDRANAANRAKTMFLSSMSHEIRTPINAVLGMDEMIIRESSEKEIISYAEDIRTAGRTLLSIINEILDFSKIEEGKMEIIPAQYELSSMINDLVNMVRDRAEKKGLGLTVNVDVNIPHVLYGDEIRIKQCALNILTNAVKYTEKGNVELNLGYEQCDDENIMLDFSIKDTGIGMKKDDIEQLFSPFSRIEEKRNRGIEGTGLGMSITKRLLALMDSSLKVVSVYGEGSEFSFSVKQKVIKAEAIGDYSVRYRSESKRAEYQAMFRAPAARVLVVDDTPVNLSVIRGLLKKTLVHIETAESGREALKMAEKSDYDIVFIDHMMPEMDGIETLKKLREIKGYSDTYCVALTANAVSGAREMYIQEGFSDYLSKPVEGERLEKMLMEYLPSEKIIKVDGIETEKPANILERLGGIEGIDPEKGLKNCGDEDSYIEVLSVYVKTAAQTADDIEKYVGAGDIANAAVKIHAVKSTARVIGADSMGKSAAKLEAACKSNNTDMLNAGISDLLSSYRALGSALAEIFTVSETDVQ